MKPTQQEIIELARESRLMSHIPFPSDSLVDDALNRFTTLLLERFGAGGGEPTGYLVGHSGEYHYFRHKADAEREKTEQERCSGESCGDVEPVFRHPSPTDLRAEYLRGLEDAAKVADDDDHIVDGRGYYDQLGDAKLTASNIREAIRALKGKQ